MIVRAQDGFNGPQDGQGGFNGPRGNRQGNERSGGMRGGMPGGMGMGIGMGRMGGFGGSNVLSKATDKANKEDGSFDISIFDAELARMLSDADNEDDGFLDQLEQEDALDDQSFAYQATVHRMLKALVVKRDKVQMIANRVDRVILVQDSPMIVC